MFKHVYETWGRTVALEFVKSTGSDETAQRADALGIKAMKPFTVIDLAQSIGTPGVGGGRVFQQTLVNEGVPYVGPRPSDPIFDTRVYGRTTAEFVKKQLAGGKAEYADASLSSQPRKYGVLHSSLFDIDYFVAQFKKLQLPVPVDAEYSVPPTQSDVRTDAASVAEVLPTLITRLKDAGVTTLIMQTNHTVAAAASRVMAQQEWYPEIVVTSAPYQDLDLFARGYDQKVWSHAFGMVWFPPYLAGHADETATAFQWFWGTDKGTRFSIAFFQMLGLYSAIQFVGPNLTAEAVTAKSLAKIYSLGVAAGGYYSKSRVHRRGQGCGTGRDQPAWCGHGLVRPRPVGAGQLQPRRRGQGQVRLPERRAALHLRAPADGEAEVLRPVGVVRAVRRPAAVRAEAAALRVRRLPEHRRDRHRPRHLEREQRRATHETDLHTAATSERSEQVARQERTAASRVSRLVVSDAWLGRSGTGRRAQYGQPPA